MKNKITLNDLDMTKRTKKYADGRQKMLKTHLGTRRFMPYPSLKAVRRKLDKHGPIKGSHKHRRELLRKMRIRKAGER